MPRVNMMYCTGVFRDSMMCIYLESEMLQEVCSAIGLVRFRPRSSIDPNTNSRGLRPWGVLGGNLCRRQSIDLSPTIFSHHTVKPFDKVVLSVTTPFFFAATGVAKPLLAGAAKGARLLKPLVRLSAKRLEAMANNYFCI